MRLPQGEPTPRLRLNRRGLTGRTATGGSSVAFQSSLERDWTILLDFNLDVTGFVEQPFTLIYVNDGKQYQYTPDILAEFGKLTGKLKRVVYAIRYRDELRREWTELLRRFQAANRHCREQGWIFEILTELEIRTPLLDNAKFLRRFRNISEKPTIQAHLCSILKIQGSTTPHALLARAYVSDQQRTEALSTLWSLIATRQISCDLRQPLTMYSHIRPVED